ncbi:MAG: FAD-dependent oxidoreductase [Deltaproteobacteria bacterium]|nr:FAD-dependent oxidoreductase [Deltaproteobacteria bacterium]MBW2139121.1 FAD-dependent oxidoreductase [Deltaproteobacteria bacterium]
MEWPYPVKYNQEHEVDTEVLVLGGGISGCWAAIAAARKGAKVALVEKGATIRSGSGGSGVDHWAWALDNPCCKVDPVKFTRARINARGGYGNGITNFINSITGYETLLELEQMGGKIRDTGDEFKGAPFRDEETKLMFAYDYENKTVIRVWGATFKPALFGECKRLGIRVYDRISATSLLTEGGKQGGPVIGATGINTRTGEFMIFKSKATVLCMGIPSRNWIFSSELRGLSSFVPPNKVGNGHAMAWRAGAELTMMERSIPSNFDNPYAYPPYGDGNPYNTWYPCSIVDAEGKEIPWVDAKGNILETPEERCRPSAWQKYFIMVPGHHEGYEEYAMPQLIPDLKERILKGEYKLPLYADLARLPEHERRVIWGMMIGSEAKTKVPILKTYSERGFDPERDLLQSYFMLRGSPMMREPAVPQDRAIFNGGGGLVVDWDLKSTLDGLYAAGEQAFATTGHASAATSGRYAGAKAAEHAMKTRHTPVAPDQLEREKLRVYAPVVKGEGLEWKELNAALCRIMQNFCGDPKSEELLRIGLRALEDIEQNEAEALFADNPHKLVRALDVLDILTCDKIIVHSCMARKASSAFLNFKRVDYPEVDPPPWHKWITLRSHNGSIELRDLPIDFWEPMKDNYQAHKINIA